MAKIITVIEVLSFHLKYCIFHSKFNFALFKKKLSFSFLNMLTLSTLLNIWNIVITAVLMSLSTILSPVSYPFFRETILFIVKQETKCGGTLYQW